MVEEGHFLGPAFQPLHDFDVQLSAVIARLDRCVDAAWGLSQTAPESERPFWVRRHRSLRRKSLRLDWLQDCVQNLLESRRLSHAANACIGRTRALVRDLARERAGYTVERHRVAAAAFESSYETESEIGSTV